MDTFIDKDVTLLLEPGAKPDFGAIDKVLKDVKYVVENIETSKKQPF